jgi:hypothetical protein
MMYAGNLGNLPLIIVPAVCKQRGNPFGDVDSCHRKGLAYASLSMAVWYMLIRLNYAYFELI